MTCDLSDAASTNWPTQLPNLCTELMNEACTHSTKTTYPDKNALNGKFVTSTQYKNCMMPESMRKTRKASMVFRRIDVFSLYAFRKDSTACEAAGDAVEPVLFAGAGATAVGV